MAWIRLAIKGFIMQKETEIKELRDDEPFPGIECVGEMDRIARGGKMTVKRLIEAYGKGIFPYYAFRLEELYWCCPLDRFVIFPEEIHISHSMRTLMNSGRYSVTYDKRFSSVIMGCALIDGRHDHMCAWLGAEVMEAYEAMHKAGLAHSVEVWEGEKLVGGLYGVALNGLFSGSFAGESMFSLAPNASKFALISLALEMQRGGGRIIDCQYETEHLRRMGGRHIGYEEYLGLMG